MEAKYLVVSLEGNIGAGKSTLFQLMREEFPEAIFLEEPLEEWQAVKGDPRLNMLEQFYAEPRRWSFTFQVHCIQSKLRAWDREIKARERKDGEVQVVFTERSIESARAVFFRNCHEKGLLNQLEHAIYEEYYAWLTEHFRKYAVGSVVYVKTPVQECFKRLKRRARSEEEGVPLEYLQQLETKHEEWLAAFPHKVIEVDATENYLTDAAVQDRVKLRLRHSLAALV